MKRDVQAYRSRGYDNGCSLCPRYHEPSPGIILYVHLYQSPVNKSNTINARQSGLPKTEEV